MSPSPKRRSQAGRQIGFNRRWARQLNAGELLGRIDELLEVTYRSSDLGNVPDVLSETVYILLSLNTREAVYRRVYATLRERFPRWVDVERAELNEIAQVLRPGGLHDQRARYLKSLLENVRVDNERRGRARDSDLTLEYLRKMADRDVERFLLSLPGVGRKAARCIMSYALDREQFAVDTHVARIFGRLGLVGGRPKPDHDAFQDLVPPSMRKRLHVNLVHHGRAVCSGPRPNCRQCVLVSFCGHGQQQMSHDARPLAIDLFAGAGGLGDGFRQAGWRIAMAVEHDRHAAQTYRANHPGTLVVEADVSKMSADHVRQACPGLGEVHAVLAGPPCQGYSSAGSRDPDDPKNLLYRHVVRIADGLRAHVIVMENVPGIRRVNGVGFVTRILKTLRRGRNADAFEVVAASYGVPQVRRRLLFLARRKDLGAAPTVPPPTHALDGRDGLAQTPRLESLLRGELELGPGIDADPLVLHEGDLVPNASTMSHSPEVVAKIAAIAPGKGPISYRRLERDIARTLVAGHRAMPVHPWLNRAISVREAARIQGFHDSYVFCGPRANQPLQVANAVPPPLAAAIADHLLDGIGDPAVVAAARLASTYAAVPAAEARSSL